MATNEILPFAQGVGANVQDQASYTAEPLRSSGNVAGIARSNVNNKALRQASVIAAGIAQFMADRQANNITDSATPANISAWMALAVRSLSSTDFLNTASIDVASASTINLTTAAPGTRHINITGTTTITAFTVAAGQTYFVRFAGALTLTNNASIVTQRGANITTAAGDTCILRATAANVVEVLCYMPGAVTGTGSNVLSDSPALTGTPTAPTAPQFDNDTSLATTAFVQRALGNFSGRLGANVSQTLPASAAGNIVNTNGSGITLILPLSTSVPAGAVICFENDGPDITIARQGGDLISTSSSNSTSITLKFGDTLFIESNTLGTWRIISGSGQLLFSNLFGSSLATSGYQKLPSGLIIQWGSQSVNLDTNSAVVFPVAFPNAFLNAHATAVRSSASNQYGVFVNSTSTTGLSIVNDGTTTTVYWMALGY